MSVTLDIIIVNWNSRDLLRKNLISIRKASDAKYKLSNVFVVDNASQDDSLLNIEKLPLPIRIIPNKANQGFAKACNQAARFCNSDFLLFLNPDTELDINTLDKVISFLINNDNKKIGICGVQIRGQNNTIIKTCRHYPKIKHFFYLSSGLSKIFPGQFKTNEMLDWSHSHSQIVDQVIGAFFLVKKELYFQLNGFDERFFIYYEEVDFCLRAKQTGWYTYYFADTFIYHSGGGTSEQVKAKRLFYSYRSRILYGFKHYTFRQASLLLLITIFIEPFTRIIQGLSKLSFDIIRDSLLASLLLLKSLPSILSRMTVENK